MICVQLNQPILKGFPQCLKHITCILHFISQEVGSTIFPRSCGAARLCSSRRRACRLGWMLDASNTAQRSPTDGGQRQNNASTPCRFPRVITRATPMLVFGLRWLGGQSRMRPQTRAWGLNNKHTLVCRGPIIALSSSHRRVPTAAGPMRTETI